jgi:hypothetical protein
MPASAFSDTGFGVLFFFTPVNIQFSKILSRFQSRSPALTHRPEKLRSNASLLARNRFRSLRLARLPAV